MHDLHKSYLESLGWKVISEEPLSLRHSDGSVATGQAAEVVRDAIRLPDITVTYEHPLLELTCEEVDRAPAYVERVYGRTAEGKMFLRPYYDEVRPGDFWVINGAWHGRREEGGFRVLATGQLLECDNSLWKKIERLPEVPEAWPEDRDDDVPF